MFKIRMFFAFILFFLVVFITGCSEATDTVAPVYRGMSISHENQQVTNSSQAYLMVDEAIQDEIKDSFGIITSEQVEYYASLNQELFLTVKLLNPDNYVILSFTLNGVFYQSYQFQEGSDSENLVLKVNSGEISGIIEFTIDAIKYIDGREILDVEFQGNKTIRVGVAFAILPNAQIVGQMVGSTSIDIQGRINDYEKLIDIEAGNLKAILYDGQQVIDQVDLILGLNSINFSKLMPGTEYQYAIAAAYDKVDQVGIQVYILYHETFETKHLVSLDNLDASQDRITFNLTINDEKAVGTIESIELFHQNVLVKSLASTDTHIFTDLLSNQDYEVKLNYSYDLNDGRGLQNRTDVYSIKTLEKVVPTINASHVATQTSLLLTLDIVDIDLILNTITLQLYQGQTLIKSHELTEGNSHLFDDLLSNTIYRVAVNYNYDANDGLGMTLHSFDHSATTINLASPVITVTQIDSSKHQINFNFSVVDTDLVGSVSSIELYKENILIKSLTDLSVRKFDELTPDTLYEIRISYAYDLNEGNNLQTSITSQTIYTSPYLDVIQTKVINTERLTEGDTVVIEITLDNPSEVVFQRVLINGDYYHVGDATTTNFIRVNMVLDASYTGGTTEFVIQKIEGRKNNQVREFEILTNNIGYAFIHGDIFVHAIEIVDALDNPLDYVMRGEQYFVKISFDNPSQYQINNVTLSYLGTVGPLQFTVNDNYSQILIEQRSNMTNTVIQYNLSSFNYSDDVSSKTKNVDGINTFIIGVIDSTYQLIYTAQDLANMKDGYAYRLANDIDMADIEWVPKDIHYISFDGNGYTISNIRTVKTVNDSDIYLGLFRTVRYSAIKNVSIYNSLYIVSLRNSSTSSNYQAYVGLIAGSSYMTTFTNVNVTGEVEVDNQTNGGTHIGGLVGASDQVKITLSYSDVILSGTNNIGGLVGYGGWGLSINRSFTSGQIFGDYHLGGLVGQTHNAMIDNSYSNMTIHSDNHSTGGLVGYAGSTLISNSYYEGTIGKEPSNWNDASGLIGEGYSNSILNAYSLATNKQGQPMRTLRGTWYAETKNVYSILDEDGTIKATESEIIDQMRLLWQLDVWSFAQSSPLLKWTPYIRIANLLVGETFIDFDIFTTDFDRVGAVSSVLIYQNDILIDTINPADHIRIESLRYNMHYRIEIVYTYNYGDDTGDQYIHSIFSVRTLPVSGTPEVTYKDITVNSDSIYFNYNFKDDLNVGTLVSIELYNDLNELVQTLGADDLILFTDLLPNQGYYIKINVSFDLNDNYGVQYLEFIYAFRTNPHVEFNGVDILNPGGIITGDTLVLQINVDNPGFVEFTHAIVNGIKYAVSSSNNNRIRIDIYIDDQFQIGETEFAVEYLDAHFNNVRYVYSLEENHSVSTFINGDLYLINLQNLDTSGTVIEYAKANQDFIVELELYNPTGYDIDQIVIHAYTTNWWHDETLNANQFTLNDDHTIVRIPRNVTNDQLNYIRIISITYSNDMIVSKTRQVSGFISSFPVVKDLSVKLITTVEDLQSIEPGYHYRLENDIDLSGYLWVPIEDFYGILDGNGYKISNLTIIQTFNDTSFEIGLFRNTNGAIFKNLIMDRVNFIITNNSTSTNHYSAFVGGLVGRSQNSEFINISILGDIDVLQINNGETAVGLLVGHSENSEFNRIFVKGSVSGKNHVGGIIGRMHSGTMSNAFADVTVEGSSYHIGNLIGYVGEAVISDSYTQGMLINNTYWASGGFIGYSNNSMITNVFSMTTDESNNYIDPQNSQWETKYTHAYSLAYSNTFTQRSYAVIKGLMSALWDNSIWSFTGEYPVLKRMPIVNLSGGVHSESDVRFNIYINDLDQIGEIYSIELYRQGVLVESLQDLNLRIFEGLRYSTNYQVKVTYVYDYEDGQGQAYLSETITLRTLDKENIPVIEVTMETVGQSAAAFTIDTVDILNIGWIARIELIDHMGQVIETLLGDDYIFEGLLSNKNYGIRVIYMYDYNDGFGENELIIEKTFKTLSKQTPDIWFTELNSTSDSISYRVAMTDSDEVGSLTKVELYFNGVLVQTNGNEIISEFTGLHSNQWWNYYMVAYYTYNLNDGQPDMVRTTGHHQYTLAKEKPEGSFETLEIYEDALIFKASLDDPYDIGKITKVEVFEGTTLIYTSFEMFNASLANLLPNTDYRIRISFTYNLNDLSGDKTGTYNYYFKTAPEVSILNTIIINETAIMVNNTVILRVEIDNPNNINFTSAIINGRSYPVSSQTTTRLTFNVLVDEVIGYGEINFVVEKLMGSFENISYTYDLHENNSETKVIHADIYILNTQATNAFGEPFEYGVVGQEYFIEIEIYNPGGYEITEIKTQEYNAKTYLSHQFEINDTKTLIRIPTTVLNQYNTYVSVTAFKFTSAVLGTNEKTLSNQTSSFVVIDQATIHEIYTVEDLQQMTTGRYYRLMNDIDLLGVSWTPIADFRGILDGNGYTISNLTIVRSFNNETAYVGLFKSITGGLVKDLTLSHVNLYITQQSDSLNHYEAFVGALAGRIHSGSIIQNVMVTGDIDVLQLSNGTTYVGLLVGHIESSDLNLVATKGRVTGKNFVGGIAGAAHNITIDNTYAQVSVEGTSNYVGGLLGYANQTIIKNAYVQGVVINTQEHWGTSGFIGHAYYVRLDNVFSWVTDQHNQARTPLSAYHNILSKEAYANMDGNHFIIKPYAEIKATMSNLWDQMIWNFFENYPTLKQIPIIRVKEGAVDVDGVGFIIEILDPQNIGKIHSIELYQQGVLTDSLTDLSLRTFNGLRYSTNYQVKVTYVYDYQDDQGQAFLYQTITLRTLDKENVPVIEVTMQAIGQSETGFVIDTVDILNIGWIARIELIDHMGQVVQELLGDDYIFEGLLSNKNYGIRVIYMYDYNDGFGENELIIEKTFKTLSKQTPDIWFSEVNSTSDSISYKVNIDDSDEVGSLTKVELYYNGVLVQTNGNAINSEFTGLYSSQWWNYLMVAHYTYNLNDGQPDMVRTEGYSFYTLPKEQPQGSFETLEIYEDSVTFNASLYDPNDIGTITKVEVFEGTTLIYTSQEIFNASLANLLPNTDYRIRISFTYNLNDLSGDKTGTYNYYFKTAPDVSVSGTQIINQEAVMMNEVLVIQVDLDNPNNVVFSQVLINGKLYSVSSQTNTRIRVDLTVDELIGAGDVTFIVEKLIGVYENTSYTYSLNANNSVSTFINGDIYILDMKIVDAAGNELEYGTAGQQYFIEIDFYNPTGYTIERIDTNQYHNTTYYPHQFTINESQTKVRIPTTILHEYNNFVSILQFAYSNDLVETRLRQVGNQQQTYVILSSNEIIDIYTASQLQNMTSNRHYRLMADIDLSNVIWQPISDFRGVFDGNGHIISNLSIVRTFSNSNAHVGLFSSLYRALIKDLALTQVNLYVTLRADNTTHYQSYVGGLAGRTSETTISNVMVSGEVTAVHRNNGETFAGLLIGRADGTQMNQIFTSGHVESRNFAGGIVAFMASSTMGNSYSNASYISTAGYQGAISGYVIHSHIYNSYSQGTSTLVNGWGIGGFAGRSYDTTFENVFNASVNYQGQPINEFYDSWSLTLNETYSLSSAGSFELSTMTAINQMMQDKWDLDIWSFGGLYPVIKRIPILSFSNIVADLESISFEINTTDYDEVGELHEISLYLDGVLVETASDNTIRLFNNLRYSTTYTLTAVYKFNYQDGLGDIFIETHRQIRTIDKENAPVVEIKDVLATDAAVTFDYVIEDILQIGQIGQIALYDQSMNLIEILLTEQLTFTNLLSNTTYVLEITYIYDFADGYGENTLKVTHVFITNPEINLVGLKILNTDELRIGDSLILEITIDNPDELSFTQVVINGELYEITNVDVTKLRTEIHLHSSFTTGDQLLHIEKLYAHDMNTEYIVNFYQENSIQTHINGDVYIMSIVAVDGNDIPIEHLTANSTYYLKVEFYNPTGYDINELEISNSQTNQIYSGASLNINADKSIIYVTMTASERLSWRRQDIINISRFNYSNDRIISRNRVVSGQVTNFVLVFDQTIIDISTPTELQNMTSGYVYQIINDIDLSGFNWSPIDSFSGVLYGNGFTIRNLNIVKTYEDETVYLGLFRNLTGASISHLNITDFSYIVNLRSSIGSNYDILAGGLAGVIEHYNTIKNLYIDGEIVVTNMTNGTSYVGGLAGIVYDHNTVHSVFVDGHYEITSQNSRIGGLVGSAHGSSTKIYLIDGLATVKGANYVGGLIGHLQDVHLYQSKSGAIVIGSADYIGGLVGYAYGEMTRIDSSYSYGNVSGRTDVGGLVGRIYYGSISNTYSTATIQATGGHVGGLIGSGYHLKIISNSYANVTFITTSQQHYYAFIDYLCCSQSVQNVYATSTLANGQYVLFASQFGVSQTQNIYSLVDSSYTETKTLNQILIEMSALWDLSIWNFEITDEIGNPTLRF